MTQCQWMYCAPPHLHLREGGGEGRGWEGMRGGRGGASTHPLLSPVHLVTASLTFMRVLDGIHSVAMANIQPLGEELWESAVALPHGQVSPCQLKVIVLVPVLEGEGGQGGRVGKLQVGKVPVDQLTVNGGHVDIAVQDGGRQEGGERVCVHLSLCLCVCLCVRTPHGGLSSSSLSNLTSSSCKWSTRSSYSCQGGGGGDRGTHYCVGHTAGGCSKAPLQVALTQCDAFRDNPIHFSPETDASVLHLQLELGQLAGCHGHQ